MRLKLDERLLRIGSSVVVHDFNDLTDLVELGPERPLQVRITRVGDTAEESTLSPNEDLLDLHKRSPPFSEGLIHFDAVAKTDSESVGRTFRGSINVSVSE